MSNISSSMYQGLTSLLDINSGMASVQNRLSTGKKLNSAADGAVQWLTVSNFQSRVSGLQSVNDGLTTALSQIKSASTALTSIRKSINETLSQLKDASTTQAAVSDIKTDTVSAADNTKFTINFTLVTGGQLNRDTSLDNANLRLNGQTIGQGAVYRFEANGTTKFVKIGKAGDALPPGSDGSSAENAIVVRTVNEFTATIGGLNPQMSVNPLGAGNFATLTANFNLSTTAGSNAFRISQVTNVANSGDMVKIFAPTAARTYNPTTGNAGVFDDLVENTGSLGSQTISLKGQTHSGTKGSSAIAADPKRAVAANAMVTLADTINSLVKDARANGINLLNGDDLTVVVNAENGSMKFQFTNSAGSPAPFTTDGLGINLTTLNLVGTTAKNFDNDTDLNAAIAALQAARDTSDTGIAKIGSWQASVETRKDFNTEINKILSSTIAGLSSNDATADAAELASLQTRQQFANSILAIIKQGEQNPLQLLR